jgi:hypothetical protein
VVPGARVRTVVDLIPTLASSCFAHSCALLDQLPAGLSTQAHLPSKDKLSAHAKENAKGSNPGLEFKAHQSGAGLSVGAKDIDEREK